MDVAISALSRSSWATLKQVSGPSAYVPDLEYALENFTDFIKPLVEQKKYLRNFFDKASAFVICTVGIQLVKLTRMITG
jgi:vacuolar protein sorting-associated protein 53